MATCLCETGAFCRSNHQRRPEADDDDDGDNDDDDNDMLEAATGSVL